MLCKGGNGFVQTIGLMYVQCSAQQHSHMMLAYCKGSIPGGLFDGHGFMQGCKRWSMKLCTYMYMRNKASMYLQTAKYNYEKWVWLMKNVCWCHCTTISCIWCHMTAIEGFLEYQSFEISGKSLKIEVKVCHKGSAMSLFIVEIQVFQVIQLQCERLGVLQ